MKLVENTKLFVWQGRTLYIGPIPENKKHRQVAASCVLSLEGSLTIEMEDKILEGRAHFIPSGKRHALRPYGQRVALIFFDPQALIAREAEGVFGSDGATETLLASVRRLDSLSASELCHLPEVLRTIPCTIEQRPLTEIYGNVKIAAVVKKMMSIANERYSLLDLAEIAGCSESRLSHIFTDEIGVPLRTLRSWLRLKVVAVHMSHRVPTTEAALRAGFFDQAHFSNTFRKIFGLSPSAIFPPGENVHWFIEAPELTLSLCGR